jgi:SRSO17 transposase
MLPRQRADEALLSIPKFDLQKDEIRGFMDELKAFHAVFADCFARSELRKHFFRYMVGQFSQLERKSIEPIALSVRDGKIRAMQRFISDALWEDEEILKKYRSLVSEDLGDEDGVLIFDESGFVKKGGDSVGVSKQYCGSVGKVENCQVGVFAAYASPQGYALVDKRLYIPQKWFGDEYMDRRKKCELPQEVQFRSKAELATEMFNDLSEDGQLPFRYVLADSVYGEHPAFIEAVEQRVGVTYFVSVQSDTLCWLTMPITREKTYQYRGEIKKKVFIDKTEKKPISVAFLARNIHDVFWYRRKVSEGAKGPIEYEFTKRRVVLAKNGATQKAVWLIMRRTIGKDPVYSFFLSNAPLSARLKLFVWLSGLRWAIEQCFEETKSELGMDHYEVRKFRGWHHHILTCMLAHFFLWHLKIRLGKKSTVYYSIAA